MRFPEGYCRWCGTWQVLQYLDAVCGKCNEAKCGDEREANTWLPQLRGGLDSKGWVPGQARPGLLSVVRAATRLDTRNSARAGARLHNCGTRVTFP